MRRGGRCDILRAPVPVVPLYRISSRTQGSVEVEASNWLVALGEGLGRLGVVATLDRIACEVLPNGTTLVRDVRRGAGFVVQPLGGDGAFTRDETEETEQVAFNDDEAALPEGLVGRVSAIMAAPDRRTAVRAALEGAMATVACEGGAVLLEQRDGSLLFAMAAGPEAPKLKNLVLPPGTGVAGFCVDHAVALTVNEPYADQRFYAEVDSHTGARTRSILCAPVAIEDRVYGCLELINAPARTGFARDALADVTLLADALGERLATLRA